MLAPSLVCVTGFFIPLALYLLMRQSVRGRFSPAVATGLGTIAAIGIDIGSMLTLSPNIKMAALLFIFPHLLILPFLSYACFIGCLARRQGRYGIAFGAVLALGQAWAWLIMLGLHYG